jgi:hypothetical protein
VATAGVVIPFVVPKGQTPATAISKEVLLRLDFEDGKLPAICSKGKVVKGPERPGNRFCLQSDPNPGHGGLIFLSREEGMFTYTEDLLLVFDIWVDAHVVTVDMNLWNRTHQQTQGIEPLRFPREQWVEGVVVPFANFKHAGGGLKPGDMIVNLAIHAGQQDGMIWIDNLEVAHGSNPPKK